MRQRNAISLREQLLLLGGAVRPPVRTHSLARLILLLYLQGVAATAAHAQNCHAPPLDSVTVWRWVDSLPEGDRPARERRVEFASIPVPSRVGCWSVVAVRWDDGLGGALAVRRASGALSTLQMYPGIRELHPVGNGRIAFFYRRGHGTGYGLGTRDDRFVILCDFGTWHWAECLNVEEVEEENSAPEWIAPDSSVGLYTRRRARIAVEGDSVLVHRFFEWMPVYQDGSLGHSRVIDQGTSVVRLP